MVTIVVTAESPDEARVAISPDAVKRYAALGCNVKVESGAGLRSRFSDESYRASGGHVAASAGGSSL